MSRVKARRKFTKEFKSEAVQLSQQPPVAEPEKIDFATLVPAFVTSELKTAFQIGFLLFIPFLIIDLVVSAVLRFGWLRRSHTTGAPVPLAQLEGA